MMNKKGQTNMILKIFLLVLIIALSIGVLNHGFTPNYKKIVEISKNQDTDGDGLTDRLESIEGSCICDKDAIAGDQSNMYYLIKKDLYNDDVQPWDEKESGYLLGYYNGKLDKTRVLINNSKPYLRFSQSEKETLESLFEDKKEKDPQNIRLSDYSFDFVKFTPNAKLRDLCIHSPTDETSKCTYSKFVSNMLETTSDGKPTGCKTDPDTCSKMAKEKAKEEESKK